MRQEAAAQLQAAPRHVLVTEGIRSDVTGTNLTATRVTRLTSMSSHCEPATPGTQVPRNCPLSTRGREGQVRGDRAGPRQARFCTDPAQMAGRCLVDAPSSERRTAGSDSGGAVAGQSGQDLQAHGQWLFWSGGPGAGSPVAESSRWAKPAGLLLPDPQGPSFWAQFHLWKTEGSAGFSHAASMSSMIPWPPNTGHGRGRTSPPLEGGRVQCGPSRRCQPVLPLHHEETRPHPLPLKCAQAFPHPACTPTSPASLCVQRPPPTPRVCTGPPNPRVCTGLPAPGGGAPPGHGHTCAVAARSASSSGTSSPRASGPSWGTRTGRLRSRRGGAGGLSLMRARASAEDPPREGGPGGGVSGVFARSLLACWGPSAGTSGPGGTRPLSSSSS